MRCLLPCLLLLSSALRLTAQESDPKALEMLDHARAVSDLDTAGLPAYRLEASFETFDETGKSNGVGTVTQMGLPNGHIKRVVTYRGKASIEVRSDSWHYVADQDYLDTLMERRLLAALFGPVPSAVELSSDSISLQPQTVAGMPAQCALVSIATPEDKTPHATAPESVYCMDGTSGRIRIIGEQTHLNTVLNRFLKLGTVGIPGDVTVMQGAVQRGQLHVNSLTVAPQLAESDVAMPAAQEHQTTAIRKQVGTPELKGKILSTIVPKFPLSEKMKHISGTVSLRIIIGRDGSVRDVEVLTATDDAFAASAHDAVAQWKYKPFFENGVAVEVEAVVTVRYSFGM